MNIMKFTKSFTATLLAGVTFSFPAYASDQRGGEKYSADYTRPLENMARDMAREEKHSHSGVKAPDYRRDPLEEYGTSVQRPITVEAVKPPTADIKVTVNPHGGVKAPDYRRTPEEFGTSVPYTADVTLKVTKIDWYGKSGIGFQPRNEISLRESGPDVRMHHEVLMEELRPVFGQHREEEVDLPVNPHGGVKAPDYKRDPREEYGTSVQPHHKVTIEVIESPKANIVTAFQNTRPEVIDYHMYLEQNKNVFSTFWPEILDIKKYYGTGSQITSGGFNRDIKNTQDVLKSYREKAVLGKDLEALDKWSKDATIAIATMKEELRNFDTPFGVVLEINKSDFIGALDEIKNEIIRIKYDILKNTPGIFSNSWSKEKFSSVDTSGLINVNLEKEKKDLEKEKLKLIDDIIKFKLEKVRIVSQKNEIERDRLSLKVQQENLKRNLKIQEENLKERERNLLNQKDFEKEKLQLIDEIMKFKSEKVRIVSQKNEIERDRLSLKVQQENLKRNLKIQEETLKEREKNLLAQEEKLKEKFKRLENRSMNIPVASDSGSDELNMKSVLEMIQKQKDISNSVMTALSGVKFFFAPEDTVSVSISGGRFNTSYSPGAGVAWKLKENLILHGSFAGHLASDTFASNVGVNFSY